MSTTTTAGHDDGLAERAQAADRANAWAKAHTWQAEEVATLQRLALELHQGKRDPYPVLLDFLAQLGAADLRRRLLLAHGPGAPRSASGCRRVVAALQDALWGTRAQQEIQKAVEGPRAECAARLYEALLRIDPAFPPVVGPAADLPGRQLAQGARELFRRLDLPACITVRVVGRAGRRQVEVRLPSPRYDRLAAMRPGATPDAVNALHRQALAKVEAILGKAFPGAAPWRLRLG